MGLRRIFGRASPTQSCRREGRQRARAGCRQLLFDAAPRRCGRRQHRPSHAPESGGDRAHDIWGYAERGRYDCWCSPSVGGLRWPSTSPRRLRRAAPRQRGPHNLTLSASATLAIGSLRPPVWTAALLRRVAACGLLRYHESPTAWLDCGIAPSTCRLSHTCDAALRSWPCTGSHSYPRRVTTACGSTRSSLCSRSRSMAHLIVVAFDRRRRAPRSC